MQWINGDRNTSDALTKRDVKMYRTLNVIFADGMIDVKMFSTAKRAVEYMG